MAWPDDVTIEQQQLRIKTLLVRDIAKFIFNTLDNEGFYYDDDGSGDYKQLTSVEDFRKIISGGGVSNSSGQQNQLVLYQQDYQLVRTIIMNT